MAKEKIKATDWYEVVFPKPKSDEEKVREKRYQKLAKEAQADLPNIERFFNEVFPHIDWSKI